MLNGFFHLKQATAWVNATALHTWARSITAGTNDVALLAVQVTHVLTVCLVAGSIGIFCLRMIGLVGAGQPLAVMAHRLLPWAWFAIIAQALTGGFMILDRPERAFNSISFPYKMIFLLAAVILTAIFGLTLRADPNYWDKSENRRVAARILGAVCLVLFVGVIFGGRWIAYEVVPA